jgi:hypothetical protein
MLPSVGGIGLFPFFAFINNLFLKFHYKNIINILRKKAKPLHFACNYLKSPSINASSSGRHTYLAYNCCQIIAPKAKNLPKNPDF